MYLDGPGVFYILIYCCGSHAGNSVLMRSEQSAYGNSVDGSVSIDMDSLQRNQDSQVQLLEQQVCVQ